MQEQGPGLGGLWSQVMSHREHRKDACAFTNLGHPCLSWTASHTHTHILKHSGVELFLHLSLAPALGFVPHRQSLMKPRMNLFNVKQDFFPSLPASLQNSEVSKGARECLHFPKLPLAEMEAHIVIERLL